jgi:hypothetical protein
MAETGLNQNYFRDYDSLTARYAESDPAGLSAGVNTYAYAAADLNALMDPDGLKAFIACQRCRGTGATKCSISEDGVQTTTDFPTNFGANDSSLTPGDPYGQNGPIPPGLYDLPNAWSNKFQRVVSSPTNVGIPGQVVTLAATVRTGIRIHRGNHSQGCLTTGLGTTGANAEQLVRDPVSRNKNTSGTELQITEIDCNGNGCSKPAPSFCPF